MEKIAYYIADSRLVIPFPYFFPLIKPTLFVRFLQIYVPYVPFCTVATASSLFGGGGYACAEKIYPIHFTPSSLLLLR